MRIRERGRRYVRLWASEAGSVLTEYSFLLILVIIVLVGTLTQLGNALENKLQDIIRAVQGA